MACLKPHLLIGWEVIPIVYKHVWAESCRPSASHMLRLCKLGRHVSKKTDIGRDTKSKHFVSYSEILCVVVHQTFGIIRIFCFSATIWKYICLSSCCFDKKCHDSISVIGSILSEYPSKALRHYLPLAKLTTHRLEVATQVSSTTFTKHFSWYSVWKYRLCVVVLCSTHAKVKHKNKHKIFTKRRESETMQYGQLFRWDSKLRVLVSVSMREPKSKVFESPKEGASSLKIKPKKCSSCIYTLVRKEFPIKSFPIKKKKPLFLLRAIHLMQRLILKNRPLAVLPNRAKWYSIHMVHMLEFSFLVKSISGPLALKPEIWKSKYGEEIGFIMRFQLQVWRLLLLVFKIKIQGLKPRVKNV